LPSRSAGLEGRGVEASRFEKRYKTGTLRTVATVDPAADPQGRRRYLRET
jgi:hypothetical protein